MFFSSFGAFLMLWTFSFAAMLSLNQRTPRKWIRACNSEPGIFSFRFGVWIIVFCCYSTATVAVIATAVHPVVERNIFFLHTFWLHSFRWLVLQSFAFFCSSFIFNALKVRFVHCTSNPWGILLFLKMMEKKTRILTTNVNVVFLHQWPFFFFEKSAQTEWTKWIISVNWKHRLMDHSSSLRVFSFFTCFFFFYSLLFHDLLFMLP